MIHTPWRATWGCTIGTSPSATGYTTRSRRATSPSRSPSATCWNRARTTRSNRFSAGRSSTAASR
ncbi:hypothetical protein AArcCO_0013 [Halalkaliarchaeum sp. AArc-CO]|nr:hypothetical protein AArcCO_0013 [Halalkaliarchaeum sp. AArc-CO]